MNARGLRPLVAATAAALIVSGCSTTTGGTPAPGTPRSTITSTSSSATTTTSTTTTAPAGMQPFSTPAAIFADVKAYWETSDANVDTGVTLVSDPDAPTCSGGDFENSTAAMCGDSYTGQVVYSEPKMAELLSQPHGPMAATLVLSHEYGHAIQRYAGEFVGGASGPIRNGVKGIELSADCLSGFYVNAREFDPAEVTAALPLTTIGRNPTRTDAFNAGMRLADPTTCFSNYS